MFQERNLIFEINRGAPLHLFWNGWESNTHVLLNHGWKFSSSEYIREHDDIWEIRLAATSPDNYVVITGTFLFDKRRAAIAMEYMPTGMYSTLDDICRMKPLRMQQFKATDTFRILTIPEMNSFSSLEPINITASTYLNYKDIRMRDFKFFKRLEEPEINKIYIPQHSVDELFNQILKIQFPQQQEIKTICKSPPIIQAQVYSLVA